MRCATALILAALLVPAARAQISTDRPGFTFGASVVDPGVFQAETGLPEATLGSNADVYQVPVQLRYGLLPGLEVRVLAPAFRAVDAGGLDVRRAFDPVVAGVKVEVPVGGVSLALITEAIVPTRGGSLGVQFNAPAAVALGDASLTLSPGVVVQNGTTTLNLVGSLGRDFGRTLGAYVEAAAFPVIDGNATPVYIGGGVLARASPDVQLDAFFDAGVSGDADDLLVGVGVSFRLK